jgi:hypothetical protein
VKSRRKHKSSTPADDAELARLASTGIDPIELACKIGLSATEARAYKLGIGLPKAVGAINSPLLAEGASVPERARSTKASSKWHQCHAYVLLTPKGPERFA